MKLICAAKDIPFEVKDVDFANMKADRKAWPFGQAPRLVDGDIDICQSNTIIRYLARKGGLNGANEKEATAVDMIMEAVESLRVKYGALIYQDQLADAAKAAYYTAHIDPSSQEGRNGGAHFGYLDTLLKASGSGFMVGSGLSAADLCVFDIVDLHVRIFPEQMAKDYPELVGLHARISELPGVKEYLAGPQRMQKINGNDLG